jgi:circadian clock protein KaiB
VNEDYLHAAAEAEKEHYVLRLYVTGMTPRSTRAISAVRALCEELLRGRYSLEIIDVYQQPALIRDEQIVATPTLVKKGPAPVRRMIGDMSDRARLVSGLGLAGTTA